MQVKYLLPHNTNKGTAAKDVAAFLRNEKGDMFYMFTQRQSRYEGWYISCLDHFQSHSDQPFLKILDRVEISSLDGIPQSIKSITYTIDSAIWELSNGTQLQWKLSSEDNGIALQCSAPVRLKLILDVRGIYQQPLNGREYNTTIDGSDLKIKYTDQLWEKPVFLHIQQAQEKPSLLNYWIERYFSRDEQRHSEPTKLYTYTLAEFATDHLFIGYGSTDNKAEKACLTASKMEPLFLNSGATYNHSNLLNDLSTAETTVKQALKWLQSREGLFAGYPWFHQVWSRDELLTALGLDPKEQLKIIQKYLDLPLKEGELPTYLGSGTTCADGLGWLCLLIREYGLSRLPAPTKKKLSLFLQVGYAQLKKHRLSHSGLVYSGYNGTWMDTIGREGYRIEIQCMLGLLLELLYQLTEKAVYHRERIRVIGRIRQNYFTGNSLKDGLDDPTQRPNIFLAYLLQPDLITSNNWHNCFRTALNSLSTNWGGLSSIDLKDWQYHPLTTGQDNQSYHNGDSWFFVNNLVALAMQRLNARKYALEITGILKSSTNEVLWEHMIGMPGEISSAEKLDSFGCGVQGFSGGAYLALLKELHYSDGQANSDIAAFWDATSRSASDSFLR